MLPIDLVPLVVKDWHIAMCEAQKYKWQLSLYLFGFL